MKPGREFNERNCKLCCAGKRGDAASFHDFCESEKENRWSRGGLGEICIGIGVFFFDNKNLFHPFIPIPIVLALRNAIGWVCAELVKFPTLPLPPSLLPSFPFLSYVPN